MQNLRFSANLVILTVLAHFEGNLKANLALLEKTQKLPKLAKFEIFGKFGNFDRVGTF